MKKIVSSMCGGGWWWGEGKGRRGIGIGQIGARRRSVVDATIGKGAKLAEAKSENEKVHKINGSDSSKIIKIEFDLKNESDLKSFKFLESLSKKVNRDVVSGRRKAVKDSDIIKKAILKITDEDLLELKISTLSKKEMLGVWTNNYNLDKGTKLSVDDFAVDVLPTLKPAELKKYQEIKL